MKIATALDTACRSPRCGAPAGAPCRTAAGTETNRTHTVRGTPPPKPRETAEYAGMVRRMITGYGRRVGQAGDVAELAGLAELAAELDRVTAQAVAGLRAHGYSWAEIAEPLGVGRTAAHKRWGGQAA